MPKCFYYFLLFFCVVKVNLIFASNLGIQDLSNIVSLPDSSNCIDSLSNLVETEDSLVAPAPTEKELRKLRTKEKLICLGLCITLGPFGVHRLYLGTSEKVPILYTLTLGGGLGVLPVMDFFTILFTKDLDKYKNNNNVFLWTPQKNRKIKNSE